MFKNKKVMITGAGRGIGKAIAAAFAEEGADLVLVDKNEKELLLTEKELETRGAKVLALTADISRMADISSVFKKIAEAGGLDILVNNAGLGKPASPYELTEEDWDTVLNTNLKGSFFCTREAAGFMKKNGGGAVIMISSTRALMSEPGTEAYAASKGGLLALTHALAVSLGSDHITVNCISPGWIETGDYSKLRPEDHSQHPSGRVGKPEDIARACLFLADPRNNFITGTNLVIDGGMTRKMIYLEEGQELRN